MTTISIRFEDDFLKDIETAMRDNRYSTKAEFVREAIRDKIKDLEKEKALMRLEKVYGASKRKTTDAQLKKAREKAVRQLAKKHGVKLD
ncbi:MAG: ribbon-helix-helix domain-containing protein [Nanoarchaeota archaeon]|nr:ribbon-helix-helix domain-containing protein [Nanoarchaeota archaeon]